MRLKLTLAILGVCAVGQGCGPLATATRVIVIEPIHYCMTGDNIVETHRNYRLAEETWEGITKAEPDHDYSSDYVAGFKDGFSDYLYAGGTGEPPPLPPRHYWRNRYETPEGHQAIDDWFAGFRHGAAVALLSGNRQWVTVPSSLPPRDAPAWSAPQSTVAPPSEPLPPPRKSTPAQTPDKTVPNDGHGPSAPPSPAKDAPQSSRREPGRTASPPTAGQSTDLARPAHSTDALTNNRPDSPVRVVPPPD
jgi:hypothetical protein